MREAHFLERGAFGFELLQHVFDGCFAFRVETFGEVFLRDADDLALHARVELRSEVFGFAGARGVVVRVDAADGVEERGAVGDGRTEGADLVQRACVGEQAIAGHAAVGGLKAHNACARGRLTNGSAGIGAERTGDRATGHGYGRTTAGATRNAGFVERVDDLAEIRGLVARAHREFVHVRLAHDNCTGGLELFDGGCGVGGHKVFENLGCRRGARAFDAHVVLHGDGDAVERSEALAFGAALVRFRGLREGAIVQYADVCIQVLGRFNFCERFLCESDRRCLAAGELGAQILDGFHYLFPPDHFMM